ncbi:Ger(x)C family spore germination protein [Fictibacillus iocasae]|uniref:Ger(X)C family spore germination protein n=1 Tax=Fictibacillus iocasae TaxID=2715437 RepID=A0ABW2NLZ2_9BACL
MKKTIISLLVVFSLTGCSDYKELTNLGIAIGFGVDYLEAEQEYELILQVVNPSGMSPTMGASGSSLPVISIVGRGRTITEAARNISKKFSREITYSQIALLVIGENLARKQGLNFIFDALERDSKVRVNIPVVLARDSSVFDVMNTIPSMDKTPAVSIANKLASTSGMLGENSNMHIYEVIEALTSKGREPVLNGVTVKKRSGTGATAQNNETLKNDYQYLNGMGIFKKGKLIGWLDKQDARSVQIVRNELKETNLSIPCLNSTDGNYISAVMTRSHADIKVINTNRRPLITIKVSMKGRIDEMMCNPNIKKGTVIEKIERSAEKLVMKEIRGGIKKAQQKKTDVYGFGDTLHRQNPKDWKKLKNNWNDVFAAADIHVKSEVKFRNTGMRIEAYPY